MDYIRSRHKLWHVCSEHQLTDGPDIGLCCSSLVVRRHPGTRSVPALYLHTLVVGRVDSGYCARRLDAVRDDV